MVEFMKTNRIIRFVPLANVILQVNETRESKSYRGDQIS